MSLVAWYPLRGDLKDKISGNDLRYLNNNGALELITGDGPLGLCYNRKTIGKADVLKSTRKIPASADCSLCCWACVHTIASGGTANGIITNHNHNNKSGFSIDVYQVNSTDFRIGCSTGHGTDRTHTKYYGTNTNIKDKWSHLCITFNSSTKTLRLYVNGVEEFKLTDYDQKFHEEYFEVFAWSVGHDSNGDYRPGVKVCDARMYSHTLSKKEIREIAKVNILHYDFENITASLGDNILKNTTLGMSSLASTVSNFKSLGNNSMSFSVNAAGTTRMSIPLDLLTANQVYKFSFIVQDPSSSVSFRIGDWCDSGTITNHVVRKIGTDRYFVSANISRSAYDSTYRFMDFNVSGAGSFYVYNIQMCPVITKIMDSSGYNNDGENHGVTFTTTSPLGTKAAVFAADKYIKVPNPFKTVTNEATFSMWINETSGADSYKSIYNTLGGPTSTYWLSVNTEGSGLWFYTGKYNNGSTTFSKNVFHHIAITFKNGTTQWYLDGNKVTTTSSQVDTTLKYSAYMALGDSYTGTSWSGTPFTGQIADFKIHATALSANDIAEEYKTRIQIARDGSLFVNRIKEDSTVRDAIFDYKMSANVNGISEYDLKNKFDGNIYEEPDGSKWIHVCHHNSPSSYLFSSDNDFANSVYVDSNRWFNMEVCNYLNSWEIMVKQALTSGGTEYKYRWTQPKNPMTAVYGDVDKADVTYNTSSGYTSTTYGGMYKNGGKAYLTANNGTNGNWWGATGCWSDYDGIPAWNGQIVSTGYYDVYVRIDNTTITDSGTNFKSFNKGTVYAKNIIEY